jgi:hypothetical protein
VLYFMSDKRNMTCQHDAMYLEIRDVNYLY